MKRLHNQFAQTCTLFKKKCVTLHNVFRFNQGIKNKKL